MDDICRRLPDVESIFDKEEAAAIADMEREQVTIFTISILQAFIWVEVT